MKKSRASLPGFFDSSHQTASAYQRHFRHDRRAAAFAGGQTVYHLHVCILSRWAGVVLHLHSATVENAGVLKANAAKIIAAL